MEVIRVHLHYVRGRLCRFVQRSHQLVICSGVANTGVADATADVLLDHPVHLRVGDQRDRLFDVFQQGVPCELRRTHEVGRVQLVLVQGVVSEHLEHVGLQADVAQEVELYIILEALTLKVREDVLGVGVVGLRALYASELVKKRPLMEVERVYRAAQ